MNSQKKNPLAHALEVIARPDFGKPRSVGDTLKNTCDALEYCRGRLIALDPTDPLIQKVDVTLKAGREMLAKASAK